MVKMEADSTFWQIHTALAAAVEQQTEMLFRRVHWSLVADNVRSDTSHRNVDSYKSHTE
jgi:hypothetical protein